MSTALVSRLRAAGCVFAEDEARLLLAAGGDVDALVDRRCAGEPLEHVLGWVGFAGLRLAVGPGVFVPRQRTVHLAFSAASLAVADCVVVELCCGIGPVAAAVADRVPAARVFAADLDPVAVGYARRNVPGWTGVGDLDEPLPTELLGRVDVLVANTPYVPSAAVRDMPSEARDHEPRMALDGGRDGLDVQRRVALLAARWLAPAGWLLVETSRDQAPTAAAIMAATGLESRVDTDDERAATVVLGQRVTTRGT